MQLIIDSKIPYIRGYAEQLGQCTYLPGADISADDVRNADALIIRTRTHCNQQLLQGSSVKIIATATIGYDHIDTHYLQQAGIAWANCPGCNAGSVAQYVECCLLQLALHGCWTDHFTPNTPLQAPATLDRSTFAHLTLAIVGVGHVGTQVLNMAQRLGFKHILLCDPPRAEREGTAAFATLSEVAQQADIISFHTPLTHESTSAHPTYHMANQSFFSQVRPGAVIINSSRGEVVDTAALKAALASKQLQAAVIDTWENEPHIDRELLQQAFISTPHIAGYSADGKANGTRMALQIVARHFGLTLPSFAHIAAPTLPQGFAYYPEGIGHTMCEELRLYDPLRDSLALKQHPELFEQLSGNYPLSREQA